MSDKTVVNDLGLYRALSQPFESYEAANEAIEAFMTAVRDLREKHRLQNVHVIVSGLAVGPAGEEGRWMTSAHNGDELLAEAMVAWAFGRESVFRQERIAEAVKGTLRDQRRGLK